MEFKNMEIEERKAAENSKDVEKSPNADPEETRVNGFQQLNPLAPEFIPQVVNRSNPVVNTPSPSMVEPGRIFLPFYIPSIAPVLTLSRFGTPGTIFYMPWEVIPPTAQGMVHPESPNLLCYVLMP